MHQAKTQLSQLIAKTVQGESFIIAKAGKPQVLVTRYRGTTCKKNKKIRFYGRASCYS